MTYSNRYLFSSRINTRNHVQKINNNKNNNKTKNKTNFAKTLNNNLIKKNNKTKDVELNNRNS